MGREEGGTVMSGECEGKGTSGEWEEEKTGEVLDVGVKGRELLGRW